MLESALTHKPRDTFANPANHQDGRHMRITISHDRPKAEVVAAVDRSFDDLFKGVAELPVKVTVQERTWQGSTLTFALTAKWGLFSTPIKGTVEVTDHDITVDADLGLLNRFVSEKTARAAMGDRIKGLLK
jgi:hypothetical protein